MQNGNISKSENTMQYLKGTWQGCKLSEVE